MKAKRKESKESDAGPGGADGGQQTKQREPVILERVSVIGELIQAHKMTPVE